FETHPDEWSVAGPRESRSRQSPRSRLPRASSAASAWPASAARRLCSLRTTAGSHRGSSFAKLKFADELFIFNRIGGGQCLLPAEILLQAERIGLLHEAARSAA